MTEPDHDDPVERLIRVTVSAAVQPVPRRLAGGRFHRGDTAEPGERGLPRSRSGLSPAASRSAPRVGSDSEQNEQRGRSLDGQALELSIECVHLVPQGEVAFRKRSERELRCLGRING